MTYLSIPKAKVSNFVETVMVSTIVGLFIVCGYNLITVLASLH